MNKKWKKASLAVVGIALVANPVTLSYLSINSMANTLYYSSDDALYDKQLEEATDIVKKAKETSTEVDVKKAIDTLVVLPWAIDYKIEEKDKLLDEIFFFIDEMEESNDKVNYGLYFVEASINRVTESLIQPDYELAYALVSTLPEGTMKDNYISTLEEINETMGEQLLESLKENPGGVPAYGFDWSRLPADAFEEYVDYDTGNYLPGYPLQSENPVDEPHPDALPEGNFSESSVYKTIGSSCYRITTTTMEGSNKKTTSKKLVTGQDASFCNVLVFNNDKNKFEEEYDFNRVTPAPPRSGDNINGGRGNNTSYFSNSNYGGINSPDNEESNLSGLTLQFTLDKTEDTPYYYETDMMVGKDGTITYQQQRDVLFQLAIHSGGKAVEDKDRFLVLIENKIIVVENNGDNIPVSSFDIILKDTKAEVKALETKVGKE